MQCDIASFTKSYDNDWLSTLSTSLCMCRIWNEHIVDENVEAMLAYMSPLKGIPLSNVGKEIGLYVLLMLWYIESCSPD